jgi:cobalamin biosynthesis protein CobC
MRIWHGAISTSRGSLREGIVVLRSFGKTYGLAGLRLGFAIAERATASLLRAALGPWVVSGPAIEVGQRALRDRGWRTDAAKARANDARRLDALLRQATGAVSTGTTLYRSIETPCASDLFAHLGRRGLWTRRFKEHRDLLRLGLPGSGSAWMRLEEAIGAFGKSPRT